MFRLFNKKKVAREAQPQSQGNAAAEANWQSILTKAGAGCDRYREAVAALNVKVICELAPLVPDQSRYDSFRREAMELALSLHDEIYRSFAIKQVKGLSAKPQEVLGESRRRTASDRR